MWAENFFDEPFLIATLLRLWVIKMLPWTLTRVVHIYVCFRRLRIKGTYKHQFYYLMPLIVCQRKFYNSAFQLRCVNFSFGKNAMIICTYERTYARLYLRTFERRKGSYGFLKPRVSSVLFNYQLILLLTVFRTDIN